MDIGGDADLFAIGRGGVACAGVGANQVAVRDKSEVGDNDTLLSCLVMNWAGCNMKVRPLVLSAIGASGVL